MFAFYCINSFAQVNLEWVNTFGGTKGAEFNPTDIKTDIYNNTYVVGSFNGMADFDLGTDSLIFNTNNGADNGIIIKYDTNGNILWVKQLVSNGTGVSWISKILIDDSLNFYIIGRVGSADFDFSSNTVNVSGNPNGYIAKYDSNCSLKWVYEISAFDSHCSDITFDINGNIVVVGDYKNGSASVYATNGIFNLINANGHTNGFLLKYSSGGNLIWSDAFECDYQMTVSSVSVNNDNDIIVSGNFKGTADLDPGIDLSYLSSSSQIYSATFFGKYDSNGNFKWAEKISSSAQFSWTVPTSQHIDDSSNVFLVGYFTDPVDFDPSASDSILTPVLGSGGDCFITKYDSASNFIWVKHIIAGPNGARMAFDSSYNIFLAGVYSDILTDLDPGPASYSFSSNEIPGTYLAKYTKDGNFMTVNNYPAPISGLIQRLNIDSNNNIHYCGIFDNETDFDFGPGIDIHNANVEDNLFVAMIDGNGNHLWATAPFQSDGYDEGGDKIILDNDGSVNISGNYSGTADFQIGTDTLIVTSPFEKSRFILDVEETGWVNRVISTYNGYPSNPSVPLEIYDYFTMDKNGNFFTVGLLSDTNLDVNPGVDTTLMSYNDFSVDIIFSKFNHSGNLIWAKSIGNSWPMVIKGISSDSSGNIYIIGDFGYDTLDVDPGPGVYNLLPFTYGSTSLISFIAKYDLNGNFLWAYRYEPANVQFTKIEVDSDQNIIVAGSFGGSIDFDFSSNFYMLNSGPGEQVFIAKYAPDASLIWANKFATASSGIIRDFTFALDNNNIVTGFKFTGTVDMNPGPPVYNVSATGLYCIASFNSDFEFKWAKPPGQSVSGGEIRAMDIAIDLKKNIYLAGSLVGTYDFITGGPQFILSSNGSGGRDIMFAKYDSLGSFVWANAFGSFGSNDEAYDIEVNSQGYIYITGEYKKTVNFETNGGNSNQTSNGFYDAFIAKYNQPCTLPTITNITSNFYSICSGGSMSLSVNGNLNDALNWTWFDDPGLTNEIGTGVSITVSPTANTTYYVMGTGFCVTGSPVGSITVTIDNNDTIPPIAQAQPATLYLDGNGTATLNPSQVDNGSIDNCGIATYSVNPNTFNCSDIGIQNVIFTATDNSGNFSTTNVSVTILDTISPTIQSCPNDTILFANSSNCTAQVVWDVPVVIDNCSSLIENVNYPNGSFFEGGTTQVNYIFSDLSGNSVGCTFNVNVDTLISIGSSIIDINCFGESTGEINISISGGTLPYNYSWSNSSTLEDQIGIPSGTYSVVVTDDNGCSVESNYIINEPTDIQLSATSQDEINGLDGSIDLTTIGGTPPYSFVWNNGLTSEDISSMSSGIYTVIVTDFNGCQDSITVYIGTQLLIENIENSFLNIFPNPTNRYLNVDLDSYLSSSIKEIRITNLIGQELFYTKEFSNVLDLFYLPSGIYTIEFIFQDFSQSYKFQKIR